MQQTLMIAMCGALQTKQFNDAPSKGVYSDVAIIRDMSLEQLQDEELAAKCRAAADISERDLYVNELFRRNYAKVARWCLRFTDDRETAADLAQEIFTKAYRNIQSFQAQAKFSTWLFSIARNHCLNAARANAKQATALSAHVDEEFISEIPSTGLSPYSMMEQKSSAKLVRELLNEALDEREKAVFTLHYGEELPLDSITRLLQLENQSGAKAYIVSAKRKLSRVVDRLKARGQYTRN
jgi:RNA polymerase sigma-70 factor (ECF subfamily)